MTTRDATQAGVFDSFWMGGYEGADHINGLGQALDMNLACGHVAQLESDHARTAALGIGSVRESIGWRLAEPEAGVFDLERARRTALSARRHGLQVIWTLMHYGTPPDVSLLDDRFIARFVAYALAVARCVGPLGASAPVYNLINEISFQAWAVSSTNLMHPYRSDPGNSSDRTLVCGADVKRRLVRATLAATAAIRGIDPTARFLQVEPIIHIAAPADRPELGALAAEVNAYQWETFDLLAGRCDADVGGHAAALDLVGVNHYHSGQWEVGSGERLEWHLRDPRRLPFDALLQRAWQRYRRPLVVAETSHVGEGRAAWLDEIAAGVVRARAAGVPVLGLCLYPLVDRPDWNDGGQWHRSGLWDVDLSAPLIDTVADPPVAAASSVPPAPRRRVLCTDYAASLQRWQAVLPSRPSEGKTMNCLIVLSHLRWNFVYQRPQHLLSRLAEHHRVVFIEEPLHSEGPPRLERIARGPNLEVLVPHTALRTPGFGDEQLQLLRPLLADFIAEEDIRNALVWFYTPMALPLLDVLDARAVIYDCMDELSAFKHAPPQLQEREAALLQRADLVLTGGPALYDAKRHRHANVHCLPSSVDAAHYAPQQLERGSAHAHDAWKLQGSLAHPRLGYFGVIDERFDIALLQHLALAHPEWQLVMVGPVVKINPADLPSAPNVHWLGMQPYERLPYLMADWDVCLMPFALNESTRFISPTKTLEYMAGEKPVVSTPVRDVVALYGETVRIAASGPDFVAACEAALAETPAARAAHIQQMLATVRMSSWDHAADRVQGLIASLRPRGLTVAPAAETAARAVQPLPAGVAANTAGFKEMAAGD